MKLLFHVVEVTRSLSNLLKGFYVPVTSPDKRVIDCNAIISEKLIQIKNSMNQEGFSEDGFSAGLNPVDVSQVLSEGNNIIGEDMSSIPEDMEDLEIAKESNKEVVVKKEVIVAEAQAEADEIVARANEDAKIIIERAQQEVNQLMEEAKNAGYAEGMAMAQSESEMALNKAMAEMEMEKNQVIAEFRKKEEEIEPLLVDTILNIFSKITRAVSVDKRDMILTLVNNVMAGAETSKDFVIRACPEDAVFLIDNKDKIIGAVREDIHIEIVSDPTMKKNDCLIDTDKGVYDCSLDIQLENLINDIRILSVSGD